ncbi:MAG: hypothetical protein ACI83I_000348 [Bacteroidia bacterium]|jgi:hypothetical protein
MILEFMVYDFGVYGLWFMVLEFMVLSLWFMVEFLTLTERGCHFSIRYILIFKDNNF